MPNNNKNSSRDLPISLKGIESVLRYLNEEKKELKSISNISDNTGLSMRVTKNILLQLEKFNQVERFVEKNNILPKWRITKFGVKVIKKAEKIDQEKNFMSKEAELLRDVVIPEDIDGIKNQIKIKQDYITDELENIQVELSKILGTVLNLNDPFFEDLMSFIIKRVKYVKQTISKMPIDPIKKYKLKKMGESEKKITVSDAKKLFAEILFLNSIILNETNYISHFNEKLSHYMENKANSAAFTLAKDIREELRLLSDLLEQRKKLKVDSHIFSEKELGDIMKNEYTTEILTNMIKRPIRADVKKEIMENSIIEILNAFNQGKKTLNNHIQEIKDNIPLYSLYQLILDEKPALSITLEELEKTINSLADKGYIPGIKVLNQDKDHFFKVVQFKAHDISEDEKTLVNIALELEKFSMADIIEKTNWDSEKTITMLQKLTNIGILKHSKSFLHGDQWYI
ncbi:MAG: hypothetical protein EU550_00545, partial [Promethearchaeota archaeon]